MKRALVGGTAAALLGAGALFTWRAEPIADAPAPAPIVFVCRNGVAMSVWSAAYFNRLAAEQGLRERAVARAAVPSFAAVPRRMAVALALDGFRLDGYRPRVISSADAHAAALVVAIDTDLPEDAAASGAAIEAWDGFPPMRERYVASRSALKARVAALVERRARVAEQSARHSASAAPGSRAAR